MIALPLFYFIFLFIFFWMRERCWNMDLAATTLLIIISANAILIDVNDLYENYGINQDNITLPTLFLFCIQWTLVLLPIHILSRIPLQQHLPIKEKTLYLLFSLVALSSFLMVITKAPEIREALITDLADVRNEHYQDLKNNSRGESNYSMFFAMILTATPFPTLALFFWFYMKAFMRSSFILSIGILAASIVQAVIAIIMAGRGAIIFWFFDFFLLFSYFYRYLPSKTKRGIIIPFLALGGLGAFLLGAITIARFDQVSKGNDPLESLYGYAGQHINNFCTMFVHGSDAPLAFDRIFPLLTKLFTRQDFDLAAHYEHITSNISSNIIVNVFDTFGAEIYLDLGWVGYISFFFLLLIFTLYIRSQWPVLQFHNVFILIIVVAFFTRGLFAWPFVHHYTTLAIILFFFCRYFYKNIFKI